MERDRVPRQPYKINKNNFSEKIFLLKSSVGKKERTQFALSALSHGGLGWGGWVRWVGLSADDITEPVAAVPDW